jgi:GNAT superfamily N-acetyltransferase
MFTVEEVLPPLTLDGPGADDFIAAVGIKNALEAEGYGTDELSFTPAESLPGWHDKNQPIRLFIVRAEGRVVARAFYNTLADDATGTAWIGGGVLAPYRRQGIGQLLFDHVEDLARAEGRSKLIVYAVSHMSDGLRLYPPTGFGSVPSDNAEVRFLLSQGFELEQVERGSRLALPVTVNVDDALARSGPDYRVHEWVGRTPDEWVDDIAVLLTRMSTDAPSAGLEEPEDVWDADRVRDYERRHESSPRTDVFAAVEHIPTGRLVGFTALSVPAEIERPISQEDTLVIRDHRGHALGMLLKLANIDHVQRVRPGHPAIITFNAEENRHMLDVNEAVGFTAIGYEGAWKKTL